MSKKKFLVEIDLRMVKRVIVEAEDDAEAAELSATISAESLALGEADDAVVLGDEPAGHGSGSVYVLAEEDDEDWIRYFGSQN